jgi:hypothetical protein
MKKLLFLASLSALSLSAPMSASAALHLDSVVEFRDGRANCGKKRSDSERAATSAKRNCGKKKGQAQEDPAGGPGTCKAWAGAAKPVTDFSQVPRDERAFLEKDGAFYFAASFHCQGKAKRALFEYGYRLSPEGKSALSAGQSFPGQVINDSSDVVRKSWQGNFYVPCSYGQYKLADLGGTVYDEVSLRKAVGGPGFSKPLETATSPQVPIDQLCP